MIFIDLIMASTLPCPFYIDMGSSFTLYLQVSPRRKGKYLDDPIFVYVAFLESNYKKLPYHHNDTNLKSSQPCSTLL